MIVVVFAAGGCAEAPEEGAEVSGTVTLDGQPLTAGSVLFHSTAQQNESYGAEIDSAGAYKIAAPIPPGMYVVTVAPPMLGPSSGPDGSKPADPSAIKIKIPSQYAAEATSPLKFDANPGPCEFPIALKK